MNMIPLGGLPVIFLERLSKEIRRQIMDSLADVEGDWTIEFNPWGMMCPPSPLTEVPWIRDSWPSSETILEYLSAERDNFESFILVDALCSASTVIAAHWNTDENGESRLDAVRVSMSIANVLLTLVDKGKVSGFDAVLGKTTYEENKIDLYLDGPLRALEELEKPSYEPPSFLPSDLQLQRSKLDIICLLEISDDQLKALKSDILSSTSQVQTVPSIVIHNWHGPSPSRSELRQLYDVMNGNSYYGERNSLAWFVENVPKGDDCSLRVVALAPDAPSDIPYPAGRSDVSLFPLERKDVLPLFNACNTSNAYFDKAGEYCDQKEKEILATIPKTIDFDGEDGGSYCPVFYLCPFDRAQEYAIQTALDDGGETFVYWGYIFPPDSGTHTIKDLFDLFQKGDPFSPTFDPSYSKTRFRTYPKTLVAVDLRCLDVGSPEVMMAHVEFDFSEDTGSGADHKVGWRFGTNKPRNAWITYANLAEGNMFSDELLDDSEVLYLHDLEEYKEEKRIEESEE